MFAGGQMATAITYNVEKFIDACVETYKDLAQATDLGTASTPFLPEAAENSIAGRPVAAGEVIKCPWCLHAFPFAVHARARALETHR
eukprot:3698382-Lingulodinium_polyedra.AAC.1